MFAPQKGWWAEAAKLEPMIPKSASKLALMLCFSNSRPDKSQDRPICLTTFRTSQKCLPWNSAGVLTCRNFLLTAAGQCWAFTKLSPLL